MRNVLARLPWRMTLLWAGLFAALMWIHPPHSLAFPISGLYFVAGITDDARYAVLGETTAAPIRSTTPTSTGRFLIFDLVEGGVKEVQTARPETGESDEAIRETRVAAGRLWIEHRLEQVDIESILVIQRSSGLPTPMKPTHEWTRTRERDIGRVSTIDLSSGKESEEEWSRSIGELRTVVFSRDGTRLATSDPRRDAISIWDVESGRLLCSIDGSGMERALSESGRYVAIYTVAQQSARHPRVHRWRIHDASTGALLNERDEALRSDDTGSEADFSQIEFADAEQTLVSHGSSGDQDPIRSNWRWETGSVTSDAQVSPYQEASRSMQGSLDSNRKPLLELPNQRWTVISNENRTFRDRTVQQLRAWTPKVVSGISDEPHRVEVWDVVTRGPILAVPGPYTELFLSSRAERLALLDDKRLRVWQLPPGKPWRKALLGSVLVPLIWIVRRWSNRSRVSA